MPNHSIHHVTAVTGNVAVNHRFYTEVLGLRLAKKTVNQDDVSAYHLYYTDSVGSPGTDITFFDWPNSGLTVPGAGTVALTSFQIPTGSLEWWRARLDQAETAPELGLDEIGHDCLRFSDPEGQRLELVAYDGETAAAPWTQFVPLENGIRGIFGVDLESSRPEATYRVLSEILGYKLLEGSEGTVETTGENGYGRIRIYPSQNRRVGRVGIGGVHHVAFRVQNDEELLKYKDQIEALGLGTSGYVDRFYFHSLYFREPGGILFELATDGPGFAADEPLEQLGQRLALPPFLEDRRKEIEAGLVPF